jgi:DNA ligase 1
MNRFAQLLDRLAYEPGRNNKLRLLTAYFREVEDPDRGYALAALTGALSFKHAKPGLIRDLITDRTDPVLFALSYDYVGDLSETVALMWPKSSPHAQSAPLPPRSGGEGLGMGGGTANSLPEEQAETPPTPDPSPPRALRVEGGGRDQR